MSRRVLVRGRKVVTHNAIVIENGSVLIEGDTIVDVRKSDAKLDKEFVGEGAQFEADFVCAGFVDIHSHGLTAPAGKDVLEFWLHDDTAKVLPSLGTTSVLASIVFGKDDELTKRTCDALLKQVAVSLSPSLRAGQTRVIGIHAEGPCVQTCGGLPDCKEHREMSLSAFEAWLGRMHPALRVMTIAPSVEYPKFERMRALLKRNIRPALGHDLAAEQPAILAALAVCAEYGVRAHITHVFNVCTFHHRKGGLSSMGLSPRILPVTLEMAGFTSTLGTAETKTTLEVPTVEVIADFQHVAPETLDQLFHCRKPQDVALISDAMLFVHEKGERQYGDRKIVVHRGKPATSTPTSTTTSSTKTTASTTQTAAIESKSILKAETETQSDSDVDVDVLAKVVQAGTELICGSCTHSLAMFRRCVLKMGVPIEQAVMMCSETPARIAGVADIGTLQPKKKADLLLFDALLNLKTVLIGGNVAFRAASSS